jgi:hypothetical protein
MAENIEGPPNVKPASRSAGAVDAQLAKAMRAATATSARFMKSSIQMA